MKSAAANANLMDVAHLGEAGVRRFGPDVAHLGWGAAKEVLNSTHPKEWYGDLQYLGDKNLPGWFTGESQATRDRVIKAHEQGYNGYTGGRAVWEKGQAGAPGVIRFARDVAIDPTTYLTAGAGPLAEHAGERAALRLVPDAAGNVSMTSKAISSGYTAAQKTLQAPDILTEHLKSTVAGVVAKTRPLRYLTSTTTRDTVRQSLDAGYAFMKRSGILNASILSNPNSEAAGRTAARTALKLQGIGTNEKIKRNIIERVGGDTNEIVKYASQAVAKNKIVTPQMVGDRVLEGGAGKSLTQVADDVTKDARDTFNLFGSNQITAKPGDTEKDIFKLIHGVSDPALKDQLIQERTRWMSMGIDPVRAKSVVDLFTPGFKSAVESDPTVLAMSDEGNAWLAKKIETSDQKYPMRGKTYGEALQGWADQALKDRQVVEKAVGKRQWKRDARIETVRAILGGDKEAQAIVSDWRRFDIDIVNDPIDEAAFQRLSKAVYADNGVFSVGKAGFFHDLAAVWKGQALLSPRYHLSNITSSWLNTVLVNGFHDVANPKEFWNQIRLGWKDDPQFYDTFASSTVNDLIQNEALGTTNRTIAHSGMAVLASDSQGSAVRVFKKIHMENFGTQFGKIVEKNRKVAAAIDAAGRGKLFEGKYKSVIEPLVDAQRQEVRDAAQRYGIDLPSDLEEVPFRDPKKLLGYYRGLGFTDGQSIHLARSYANKQAIAEADAIALVHKGHFSYYRTNLDDMIGKFAPFHYYASRSTLLYGEEMARNPILLVNFARLVQELDGGYQDHPGLNARQKGWMYVMSGPAGFSFLANPDALFGFTRSFGLMGNNYQNDQTQLGGILNFMKSGGYGLYPIFDGLFNMAGTYGDTYEPDLLGIRHRALIGSIVNWASAESGVPAQDTTNFAPYAELNADMRQFASGQVAKFLPGWLSQPVSRKANDTGTIGEASMEGLIESRIISNHPDLTNQQLFDLMNNPDGPEYQTAWREVARTGVANQLMGFLLPTSVKLRDNANDVRSAQLSMAYSYAKKYNVSPTAVTPSIDAQFATQYKQVTGKDWKPGDFEKAAFQKDMQSSTDEGRRFVMKDYQYRALGSKLGRDTYGTFEKISHGELVPPGFSAAPKGEEDALAQRWLYGQSPQAQIAMKETLQLRDGFKQLNPDYAQYKDWQGQMSYLRTLLGGSLAYYREQVSKSNPNAAKYFDAKRKDIGAKYKDPKVRDEQLDFATTSADAWLAINGTARQSGDAAPLSTTSDSYPPQDTTGSMLSAFAPSDNTGGSQLSPQGSFLQRLGR